MTPRFPPQTPHVNSNHGKVIKIVKFYYDVATAAPHTRSFLVSLYGSHRPKSGSSRLMRSMLTCRHKCLCGWRRTAKLATGLCCRAACGRTICVPLLFYVGGAKKFTFLCANNAFAIVVVLHVVCKCVVRGTYLHLLIAECEPCGRR